MNVHSKPEMEDETSESEEECEPKEDTAVWVSYADDAYDALERLEVDGDVRMPRFQQINFLNQKFIENFEKEWLRLLELRKDKLISEISARVRKLMEDDKHLEESEAVKIAIDHRKYKILEKVDWDRDYFSAPMDEDEDDEAEEDDQEEETEDEEQPRYPAPSGGFL